VGLKTPLQVGEIAGRLACLAPADLEAICSAAKRFAFNRADDRDQLPPLSRSDLEQALNRMKSTV